MGLFSWDCNVCGHALLHDAGSEDVNNWMGCGVAAPQRGRPYCGDYDGYGRLNGAPIRVDRDEDAASSIYHYYCYLFAGEPGFTFRSRRSDDQGHFYDEGDHDLPPPPLPVYPPCCEGLSEGRGGGRKDWGPGAEPQLALSPPLDPGYFRGRGSRGNLSHWDDLIDPRPTARKRWAGMVFGKWIIVEAEPGDLLILDMKEADPKDLPEGFGNFPHGWVLAEWADGVAEPLEEYETYAEIRERAENLLRPYRSGRPLSQVPTFEEPSGERVEDEHPENAEDDF